uniref:Vitamin B12-dependent ribonucleotide reductase n=1 Tax=uncultured Chloroflexota bacterium TaxID=166587 RepID=H5SAM1_9CHLR|nr:ribonucleoside-diphosphate reductase alpha chain [uncultured Chloroflexota bacterium]
MSSPSLTRNGLLPTPPIPEGLPKVELTENARQVLTKRYLRRGDDGKPVETVEEMFWRVAWHVARVEEQWGADVMARAMQYYHLLTSKKFFPNSPTFTGAGTPLGQLAACFVLPLSDDMGRDEAGIFQTLRNAALIQQTGGGNGFSFSRLRPKGALVKSSAGQATGPVGFLRVYDKAFGEIAQGGTRRGANMAVLRVDHPDIEEFITCKTDENAITNFNISVGITDAFMRAVENDEEWELRFPDVTDPRYRHFNGTLEDAEKAGIPIKVYKKVRARELFDKIVRQAHHNGEPGMLFLDAANRSNPVPHLYTLEATNPCGEQWLGPFENCCLGSVNLAEHCAPAGKVDWETLRQSVETATRFLDDVVEANAYVPAVPQLKEAAHRARRIGLGIMGLADLMYHVGVRYGSEEGQEFASQVMEFIRYHAMKTSIELAKERGPFPAIQGSIYDPENLKWQPPRSLVPYRRDWGRPPVDWEEIVAGIRQHGIRNAAQTTIAPTGCVVPGTLISTDRGLLPIETLGNIHGDQWQEVQLQVSSEGGERTATHFYINGQAHTLRVTTRRGYAIQGTDGHRIRVLVNGELVWKRLDELKPGMKVPLQSPGLIGAPRTVNLDTTLETDFHASPVTLPEVMTPELAYLIGLFMGDGSLKERSLRFALADRSLQRHVAALLEQVFGIAPKVQADARSAALFSVEIHSRNVVAFWQRNGFAKKKPSDGHSGKGYTPHIPLAVLQTNNADIYAAFLAGLFDADGYLHGEHLPVCVTTDRNFHDQVKTLLLTLNILTTSDVQQTGMSRAKLYRLRVAHTQAAEIFQQKIGRHLVRFAVSGDVVRRKTLGDRIPILEEEYRAALALAADSTEAARLYGWRRDGWMASRTSIQSFVERHREALQGANLERWAAVLEEGLYFDEIASIEDGGVVMTYDLSVPGTHAYHANGFISHNTIATVAGTEGYGCEPVFALAYIRHVNDKGRDLQLTYASKRFEQALIQAGIPEEQRQAIYELVLHEGTCQNIPEVPEEIRRVFVVAADVTAEEHVRMQAALQAFVDNSISKTINFPETATEEDVATAYKLAWKLGAKGITVYVTGSREKVVLETRATAEKKQSVPAPASPPAPMQPMIWHESKKPRPRVLAGRTYSIETPLGKAFITINENGQGQPFEVFINTSKAGSETAAVSEAIGRLISFILRLASPVSPLERVREIVKQLTGIGGGRALGFGPNRVRSLPDGVGQVLEMYLEEKEQGKPGRNGKEATSLEMSPIEASALQPMLQIGDLCPECGEAALVNEEGCRKCYACGYSEC